VTRLPVSADATCDVYNTFMYMVEAVVRVLRVHDQMLPVLAAAARLPGRSPGLDLKPT
jgi:hypothetical protein